MLILISPAKSLDFERPLPALTHSQPDFLDPAARLIAVLREKPPAQIASLMSISDQLAALNVARFADWAPPFTPANARQAVLAFNGDVYEGLDAWSLSPAQLDFAQLHLRILSGLYGVLRPLDLMQAYRLEMGSKLANPGGKDLYAFWGDTITNALNQQIAALGQAGEEAVVVNLASEEYFKSVRPKKLAARIVTPVFEERKGDGYKIISFYAKRARGLMSRYAIVNSVSSVSALKDFDLEGYKFEPKVSDDAKWVFRRDGVEKA